MWELTSASALKVFISREKAKSYEEAPDEMKAAVETANIATDTVGTFKDGQDTLKAQVLYLLRSKLDTKKDNRGVQVRVK